MKYEIKLSVHTAQLLYVNAFFTKIRFPIPEFSVSHCTWGVIGNSLVLEE